MASTACNGLPDFACEPPHRWEKGCLVAFLTVALGYGVYVEIHSSFISTRKTDLGVFLRAGWAVRSGENIYEVTDNNGWHYAYPPFFAVLMVPFADAPNGHLRDFMLPYPATVAIWYVLSLIIVLLATHWFATAFEESSIFPAKKFGRRWLAMRMAPIYFCLVPIGGTLNRGQVNLMVVALIAGMFLATVRGQRFRSGIWLAAAVCLKLFPAFLILFPLWRRDGRALAGVAVGLIIGVAIVPSLVWGVMGAAEIHEKMFNAIIKPGLGLGGEKKRDKELMEITATDNQSIQAVTHYYLHWDKATRPRHPNLETKLVHVLGGVLLTSLLLIACGWKRDDDPIRMLLFLGGLTTIMTITSPVSHTHYFCMVMPLVIGLLAWSLRDKASVVPSSRAFVMLGIPCVCISLSMIPFWPRHRELGLSPAGCLLLLAFTQRALSDYAIRLRIPTLTLPVCDRSVPTAIYTPCGVIRGKTERGCVSAPWPD